MNHRSICETGAPDSGGFPINTKLCLFQLEEHGIQPFLPRPTLKLAVEEQWIHSGPKIRTRCGKKNCRTCGMICRPWFHHPSFRNGLIILNPSHFARWLKHLWVTSPIFVVSGGSDGAWYAPSSSLNCSKISSSRSFTALRSEWTWAKEGQRRNTSRMVNPVAKGMLLPAIYGNIGDCL